MHIDVLGLGVAVNPGTLTVGTCELAELLFRHKSTRLVVVTIKPLPAQLEPTISTGRGSQSLCDPAFRIRSNLLINPLLQTLLIGRGPTLATQRLTRKVVLRVRLNLVHRVVGEVGADDLQTRGRDVLRIKFAYLVVVLGTLKNV